MRYWINGTLMIVFCLGFGAGCFLLGRRSVLRYPPQVSEFEYSTSPMVIDPGTAPTPTFNQAPTFALSASTSTDTMCVEAKTGKPIPCKAAGPMVNDLRDLCVDAKTEKLMPCELADNGYGVCIGMRNGEYRLVLCPRQ